MCSILNLPDCIPQKAAEYIVSLLNMAISPLLDLTKKLFTEPVSIELFKPIWTIIVTIISFFYGILLVYAGIKLMMAFSPEKRAIAKEQLTSASIMILLVQFSFFIYSILLDVSGSLSSYALQMVDERFFLLTADNIVNFSLQLLFAIVYALVLVLTVILFALRYILVSVGVIMFPIAIILNQFFLTKSIGRTVILCLIILMILPFLDAFVFVVVSQLLTIPSFENVKILLAICTFLITDIFMLGLVKLAVYVVPMISTTYNKF